MRSRRPIGASPGVGAGGAPDMGDGGADHLIEVEPAGWRTAMMQREKRVLQAAKRVAGQRRRVNSGMTETSLVDDGFAALDLAHQPFGRERNRQIKRARTVEGVMLVAAPEKADAARFDIPEPMPASRSEPEAKTDRKVTVGQWATKADPAFQEAGTQDNSVARREQETAGDRRPGKLNGFKAGVEHGVSQVVDQFDGCPLPAARFQRPHYLHEFHRRLGRHRVSRHAKSLSQLP